MALTTTTASSAIGQTDTSIVVASATGFAAGYLVRVDSEFMKVAQSYVSGTTIPVVRGQDGSAQLAHKVTANVTVGTAADFAAPPVGVSAAVTNPVQPAFGQIYSYSAAGAISPVSGIHIINGTSNLAMTLAVPTKDQDGTLLVIVANGKAAHTVTVSGGLGAGSTASDVGTFSSSYQGGCILCAANGAWVLVGNGVFSATAATGAPLWA